jgi:ectoine hydroxylase-related dioxygenase (phytanoyl-CoA dioxygenase family)
MRIEGDFARDGAVCVRGAVDAEHVELARQAIEANLADLSPLAKRASADDDGAFIEDFCNWQRLPAIERFVAESGVAAIAAELMGSRTVRLYHDHVLVKEPGTRQRTPWHQDQPYYNVDGRGVSAWIPVDPVPAAGSLELLAGSHAGPWLMPRTFLSGEAKWFPEGSLAELPDIEADRAAFDLRRYELQPGDAVFFDFLTVHGAPGFPFAGRRRVLSLRYLSAEARHAPRRWRTSPPFEGLADELPDGAELAHPLFPVVWPR